MTDAGNILAADIIERRLECVSLPQGWTALGMVLLLAALLYAVVFFYRREQRAGASSRVRMLLAALRCTVIALLAVIWTEPILATYIHRKIESVSLLLVDGSASMGLRDLYPNADDAGRVERMLANVDGAEARAMSRAELVRTVLTHDRAKLLHGLSAGNKVQIYQFGDKLDYIGQIVKADGSASISYEDSAASQPAEASDLALLTRTNAPVTDVGRAVRQAIESHSAVPIAAVVVFSDGRFNRGEPVEVVARYTRAKKIPIHAVGVGDPSPPRNVAVNNIEAPPNVFVKDPFKVVAHLRAQGFDGAELPIELLERRQDSEDARLIETRRITIGPEGRIEPVVFDHQIGEASEMHIQIRVPTQDSETLTDDNDKEVVVRALANKMRVLLLAGAPTWEYRYLARLLERDETVDVSCWLQSADEEAVRDGNTVIKNFPRKPEELSVYDCIILLDPQPVDFDPAWSANIESLVGNKGGGLLYVAGRTYGPRFAHEANTRELLDLLPVVIDAGEADLLINELGHYQATAWPMVVPLQVASHPVISISDQPGENVQIWSQLPGVYWHYPVRREKPVATVLLRHSNPRMRNSYGGHVLLATQFFGSGRTAFLGFDTTWRWRRAGDKYFNRFWIQLLRHLVEGKLLSGQKRGLIQVERDSAAIGEPVTIEARLADTRHMPMQQERIEAGVSINNTPGQPLTLELQPGRPGWYRGQLVPTEIGTYGLQIELPGGNGTAPATIRGQLRVGQADLEFQHPELDRKSLLTLASGSAGGRYLDIDQTDELVSLIPNRTSSMILTGQPETVWDRWWTLFVLMFLLALEWVIRKRSRLL